MNKNPYKIGPYCESEAELFKGRTSEIESMYQSFLQHDYLVCYANSGEGKSSILNAGLFPKLRRHNYFPISIRFRFDEEYSSSPNFDVIINDAIDESLAQYKKQGNIIQDYSLIFDTDDTTEKVWQETLIKQSVWLRLRYTRFLQDEIRIIPVLVFDQFEEVFTNPKSEIWTKKFFQWLEELSTDVCPYVIQELIRDKTNDEMPLVSSSKKFKAIYSLRSEYVAQVDYWGMQYYYIPDLKNNRYFLKALTPESAREVILQPNGLYDISEKECNSIISGCCGNNDYVNANLPCVPASVLSIICYEVYELSENKRKDWLRELSTTPNTTVEDVLERYYESVLTKCGIRNDRQRDAFENALVDDKGNRKRIGIKHQDFEAFSSKQINDLIENKLLRIVSKTDDINGDIVELPHDRFCKFILNHKNKRFEEIEAKRNRLKETIAFLCICGIFGILALSIHNNYIDKLAKFLHGEIGLSEILSQAQYYSAILCILLSLIITPIAIIRTSQQSKNSPAILSTIGILISVLILIETSGLPESYSKVLASISLFVNCYILIHTLINLKNLSTQNISWWPLYASLFLLFTYLFFEFLRNCTIGISEPKDSFIFVLILPCFLMLWTFKFFRANTLITRKHKCHIYIKFIIYFALLGLLSVNNLFGYDSKYKLGFTSIIILLILLIILIITLLKGIQQISHRTFATLINITVLVIVFILNLGYNPFLIKYSNNIENVYSWRTIAARDSASIRVLNAKNGDTLLPYATRYSNQNTIEIESHCFIINPILSGRTTNTDKTFTWDSIGKKSTASIISIPTLEEDIYKLSNAPKTNDTEEQIRRYAAKTFLSLRNNCIKYAIRGSNYSLSDIEYIDELKSCQDSLLKTELEKLSITAKNTSSFDSPIDKFEDKDLISFYSAITRSMFIYILRDRVLRKDYTSVFTLGTVV